MGFLDKLSNKLDEWAEEADKREKQEKINMEKEILSQANVFEGITISMDYDKFIELASGNYGTSTNTQNITANLSSINTAVKKSDLKPGWISITCCIKIAKKGVVFMSSDRSSSKGSIAYHGMDIRIPWNKIIKAEPSEYFCYLFLTQGKKIPINFYTLHLLVGSKKLREYAGYFIPKAISNTINSNACGAEDPEEEGW